MGGSDVAGHAPCTTGTEGDVGNLWAIGHATALELLAEKAPEEGAEPVLQFIVSVFSFCTAEDLTCHEEDAARAGMTGYEVPEKEVMQLVWADGILGLLFGD